METEVENSLIDDLPAEPAPQVEPQLEEIAQAPPPGGATVPVQQVASEPEEVAATASLANIFVASIDALVKFIRTTFVLATKGMIIVCCLLALYHYEPILNELGLLDNLHNWQIATAQKYNLALLMPDSTKPEAYKGKVPNLPASPRTAPIAKEELQARKASPIFGFNSDFSQAAVERAIKKWARHYNVDEDLAFAVAEIESSLEPLRTRFELEYFECYVMGKKAGCHKASVPRIWKTMMKDNSGKKMLATSWGLFQLMPLTAAEMAKKEGILNQIQTIPMLLDVELNARLGIAYLSQCIRKNPANLQAVAKCYNGPQTSGWSREVGRVMTRNILTKTK